MNQLAEELRPAILIRPPIQKEPVPPERQDPNLHIAFTITARDLRGPVKTFANTDFCKVPIQQTVNGFIAEIALADADRIANFAVKLHCLPSFRLMSLEFIAESIFEWLVQSATGAIHVPFVNHLESKLHKHVVERCIWFPIAGLRLRTPLQMGSVVFRAITRQMIDQVEQRLLRQAPAMSSQIQARMLQMRRLYQGRAAAEFITKGEMKFVVTYGRKEAEKATGILRFASPANFAPDFRTQWSLTGTHSLDHLHWFEVHANDIVQASDGMVYEGSTFDGLDPHLMKDFPSLLGQLHRLLSREDSSEFKKDLVEALLLYSRNAVTTDVADKLVYILVALESILLKNTSEPIQRAIGERMAFICERTAEERMKVVKLVSDVYAVRSAFVHHGENPKDIQLLRKFMPVAWTCFLNLICASDQVDTVEQLLSELELRKFS
jgi:hypothetical protein